MNYNIKEVPASYGGIYKLTFPNGKIYIGLSNNINRRLWEHEYKKTNQPISFAIQKYGMPQQVDVLTSNLQDRNKLKDQEKYYIGLHQSNQRETGYNLTEGGDGADSGVRNVASIFTEEDIAKIKVCLASTQMSVTQIAKQFNCHSETVSRINTGRHYHDCEIDYPIRTQYSTRVSGTKVHNAAFNDEQVAEIIDLLKNNSKLSMAAISRLFGVDSSVITNLNKGRTYFDEEQSYPIRVRK